MADVTLRDVLAMPVLRAAEPEVLVADEAGLDRRVRWVHATELPDIAPLLRGGDLVLTTGIALPEAEPGLAAFATSLADVGAAGLILELGRRWAAAPPALVAACAATALPLVCLHRVTRFASITQAVGERVVDEQLAELREAERVHETFTALSLAEADPAQILAAVQRLAGAAVVLESEQHQVVDYLAGPDDPGDLLDGWTARSRRVALAGRTTWDEREGWLLTRLGPLERGWGRLVVRTARPPSQRLVAIAERGAAALALHRLHDRDRDNLVRRTHHELLLALLSDPTADDVVRRCELAGLPTTRRQYVGLTVRPRSTPGRRASTGDVLATVVHAAHEAGLPALISELDHDVRVLLALPPAAGLPAVDAVLDRLATAVRRRHAVLVGAGRPVPSLATVDRTLRESRQVADAVRDDAGPGGGRAVHRLEDVHLRGLLALLGDDDRLRLFVDRELEPLRRHDAEHGTDLLPAVRALFLHPAGKARAAASLHLSRPAYYARLAKAEAVLGERLDDPDIRAALHVALMAAELTPRPGG